VAPASFAATDGQYIAIRPLSNTDVSNFTGLLTEDFPVYAEMKPGSTNANSNFANGKLIWKVERVSGPFDVVAVATTISAAPGSANNTTKIVDNTDKYSASANLTVGATGVFTDYGVATATMSNVASVWAGSTSATLSAKVSTNGTGYAPLFIRAFTASDLVTSVSTQVTVRVTVWIDEVGGQNNLQDADEWYATQLITLKPSSGFSPSLTVGSPAVGDTVVTASATLAGLNYSNLGGKVFLALSTSATTKTFEKDNAVDNGLTVTSSAITGAVATARAGVVSESFDVIALTESQTIGVQLRYLASGNPTDISSGVLLGATGFTSARVSPPGVDTLSLSAVLSDYVAGGGNGYAMRQNQTLNFKVAATSNSNSVSNQAITIATGGTGLATSSRMISVNGGSWMTTHDVFTVTTGTDGFARFTVATSGYSEASSETLTLQAKIGTSVVGSVVTLTATAPTYTVTADYSNYLTAPGTAVNVGVTVADQYGATYAGSDHYIKATRSGSGFNFSPTISYHVVSAGVASFGITPQGATATGSVTVALDIMQLINGTYVDKGTEDSVAINVSSVTSAFGTGLRDSYSANVSYFPSTVSWATVTAKVTNTGSAVVVAGTGLIFRASSAVPATTSGGITVRADGSLNYTFQVASLTSGTHTMTMTNGSASTSSLFVVAAAPYTSGATVTLDTTEITAGKTKIVTGTLTDANGNPVATAGTASILVTYAGTAGIPVGSMPTTTDADGKFRVSILTSAADNGTFTLTVVYNKNGASTVAADKITKVHTITVGSAAASADQKVNAGSFKGYVAIYAKGYEGQRLSAKVGKDWVVVQSLASDFERVVEYTGAGYTIAVRIYIDRVLVDTITVTTK